MVPALAALAAVKLAVVAAEEICEGSVPYALPVEKLEASIVVARLLRRPVACVAEEVLDIDMEVVVAAAVVVVVVAAEAADADAGVASCLAAFEAPADCTLMDFVCMQTYSRPVVEVQKLVACYGAAPD